MENRTLGDRRILVGLLTEAARSGHAVAACSEVSWSLFREDPWLFDETLEFWVDCWREQEREIAVDSVWLSSRVQFLQERWRASIDSLIEQTISEGNRSRWSAVFIAPSRKTVQEVIRRLVERIARREIEHGRSSSSFALLRALDRWSPRLNLSSSSYESLASLDPEVAFETGLSWLELLDPVGSSAFTPVPPTWNVPASGYNPTPDGRTVGVAVLDRLVRLAGSLGRTQALLRLLDVVRWYREVPLEVQQVHDLLRWMLLAEVDPVAFRDVTRELWVDGMGRSLATWGTDVLLQDAIRSRMVELGPVLSEVVGSFTAIAGFSHERRDSWLPWLFDSPPDPRPIDLFLVTELHDSGEHEQAFRFLECVLDASAQRMIMDSPHPIPAVDLANLVSRWRTHDLVERGRALLTGALQKDGLALETREGLRDALAWMGDHEARPGLALAVEPVGLQGASFTWQLHHRLDPTPTHGRLAAWFRHRHEPWACWGGPFVQSIPFVDGTSAIDPGEAWIELQVGDEPWNLRTFARFPANRELDEDRRGHVTLESVPEGMFHRALLMCDGEERARSKLLFAVVGRDLVAAPNDDSTRGDWFVRTGSVVQESMSTVPRAWMQSPRVTVLDGFPRSRPAPRDRHVCGLWTKGAHVVPVRFTVRDVAPTIPFSSFEDAETYHQVCLPAPPPGRSWSPPRGVEVPDEEGPAPDALRLRFGEGTEWRGFWFRAMRARW